MISKAFLLPRMFRYNDFRDDLSVCHWFNLYSYGLSLEGLTFSRHVPLGANECRLFVFERVSVVIMWAYTVLAYRLQSLSSFPSLIFFVLLRVIVIDCKRWLAFLILLNILPVLQEEFWFVFLRISWQEILQKRWKRDDKLSKGIRFWIEIIAN